MNNVHEFLTSCVNSQFMLAGTEEKQNLVSRGKNLIALQIFSALKRRDFSTWFATGDWDAFISGDEEALSEEEILKQIKNLFNLN